MFGCSWHLVHRAVVHSPGNTVQPEYLNRKRERVRLTRVCASVLPAGGLRPSSCTSHMLTQANEYTQTCAVVQHGYTFTCMHMLQR